MTPLRIATRKSPLALWQAEYVAERLRQAEIETVLVPMVSSGDTDMRPIDGTRQVGLFTKRIQLALLENEADIAVHSLKDLPTEPNANLSLAAVPERETVLDSLVAKTSLKLHELPPNARIGTGSQRRAAQLRNRRPDLNVMPIRGNVQTRLGKLDEGEFDAIMLAEAGILRLEMHDLPRTQFPIEEMLPAPGQGALGIEIRKDDTASEAVRILDHLPTRAAVTAERKLLASLHGGCLAPIAALGRVMGDTMQLKATVLSHDGTQRLDETHELPTESDSMLETAEQLAELAATALLQRGAADLINAAR
ncbi:MAG: hydroxymethylbilane synthase [Planctomycetaceae bacterium TMED240]|nr:hydroxymethylbilane synthase [Rhodopirellula sp.]OUX06693.1 MAG: hydroxymethylbilane synthase [Planctomycetaceae bacterium TMED240]